MSAFPQFRRHHEIRRIRGALERDSFPRLQMLVLVTLTGASGFVASYALLHAGLVEMWLRYLASIGLAYLMFLFLLWLWLRTRAEDYADFCDYRSTERPNGDGLQRREAWIRDRLEALALYQHHERVNARHYVDGGYPDRPFKVG